MVPAPLMYDQAPLLEEIAAFIEKAGISEATFGARAINDGKVVARVRDGGVTLKTIKRLRAYMAAERAKAG